jgi:hypothetical protein
METDGFLGRWSRRKLGEDKADRENAGPEKAAEGVGEFPLRPLVDSGAAGGRADVSPVAPAPTPTLPRREKEQEASAVEPLLPTLQDVQALTPESDFKPYLSRGVEPQVRNAAMKKLFADPRYNVMDRLDTYIDDYSKPDPIPESMLRRMASAQFLGLFEDKEKPIDAAPPGDVADTPEVQSVAESDPQPMEPSAAPAAQSALPVPEAATTQATHENSDLRLQPDDAAPGQGAGRSAG